MYVAWSSRSGRGGGTALFKPLYRNTTEIEKHNLLFYNTFTMGAVPGMAGAG
jgi:hypothetical protein